MTDPEPDDLQGRIAAMTRRRAADPLGFLADVLESVWLESDEADVAFLWTHRSRVAPWWIDNALAAFATVLADPPEDLCSFIETHAGRAADSNGRMYGDLSCLDWLRTQRDLVQSLTG
jgi:hypothetical protein